jgi:hypothetical protein
MNYHQLSLDAQIGEVNSFINLWKEAGGQIGQLSDGFHNFDQLYQHRIELFITVCKQFRFAKDSTRVVWFSRKHSDGTEWPRWFILGIGITKGHQITYHLPVDPYLNRVSAMFEELPQAPEYDGHTSDDVIERLKKL